MDFGDDWRCVGNKVKRDGKSGKPAAARHIDQLISRRHRTLTAGETIVRMHIQRSECCVEIERSLTLLKVLLTEPSLVSFISNTFCQRCFQEKSRKELNLARRLHRSRFNSRSSVLPNPNRKRFQSALIFHRFRNSKASFSL